MKRKTRKRKRYAVPDVTVWGVLIRAPDGTDVLNSAWASRRDARDWKALRPGSRIVRGIWAPTGARG